MSTDTIAAIGTALSNSGISIIRISGKDSLNIIRKIFVSNSKIMPNNIIYGKIVENGNLFEMMFMSQIVHLTRNDKKCIQDAKKYLLWLQQIGDIKE